MREDLLFVTNRIYDVIETHRQLALKAVDDLREQDFAEKSHDDLREDICQKYALIVPTLSENEISVSQREVDIPIRSHRDYGWIDDTHRSVRGVAVDVKIPFEGDGGFFTIQPNTHDFNPPCGRVRSNMLVITVCGQNLTTEGTKAEIDQNLASLNKYLTWHREALKGFDEALRSAVSNAITQRQEKLKANSDLISNLGYKVEG